MATREKHLSNAIRPSKVPAPAKTSGPEAAADEESLPNRRAAPPVPEEITRRFVQVGSRYYFPDGARAFTDRGNRLSTPSENTEVVRSLVSIAQARGWQSIAVTGTERFRKEVWFEARLQGLTVRGYRASEIDEERLVRRVAERGTRGAQGSSFDGERSPRDSATAEPTARAPAETPARDRLLAGRLIDHGQAPYRHQRKEATSYFVKLETPRGERTLWGVDLERALKESLTQPKVGDEVGLRAVREEPVTVKAPRRNADGRVVGEQELETHRNRWVIERREFFEARNQAAKLIRDPKIDAREAVKQHPELASTYLHLKGAQEVAASRIRDPKDQQRFVALVRSALADSIERGEPLQPVRLQTERSEPIQERPPRGRHQQPPTR
jgi:putative DNA primase/helicase